MSIFNKIIWYGYTLLISVIMFGNFASLLDKTSAI
ncbi:MAG: hypothetical protein ACI8Q2_000333, partial [Candidatus Omnitrophota bacterium]